MRLADLPFAILALSTTLAAQRIIEVEPNDTAATAQAIVPGNHVVCSLAAGEQDWFSFSLPAPRRIRAWSSSALGISGLDVVIRVFDSAGVTQHAWNDGVGSADCGVTLPAGSYTIRVNGFSATTAGNYVLDLNAMAVNTPNVSEGPEPNDTFANATPITLGDLVGGNLSAPTDVDAYSFTLTAPAVVQIDVSDDSTSPQLDDTTLAIYDSAAVPIGGSVNMSFSHRAEVTTSGPLPPGSYMFRVSTTNPPAAGYAGTGNYTIRTKMISLSSTPAIAEGPEPNNTFATATPLVLGIAANGNITPGDADFYVFTTTQSVIMALRTVDGTAPAITATAIRVRHANGTLMASSTGLNSHAAMNYFNLDTPGTYIIDVGGGTATATGNYTLLTGMAVANLVDAVCDTYLGGGCAGSAGIPALTPEQDDKPVLGSAFVLRGSQIPANAPVITMVGFSDQTANGGSVPLPFDLTSMGAPSCFIRVDPRCTNLILADANGGFLWIAQIGPELSLRGIRFYQQFMVIDPAANALGVSVSNLLRSITGDRYLL